MRNWRVVRSNLFEILVVLVALLALDLLLPFRLRFERRLFADEVAGVGWQRVAAIVEPPLQFAAVLPVFLVGFQVVIIPCWTVVKTEKKKQTKKEAKRAWAKTPVLSLSHKTTRQIDGHEHVTTTTTTTTRHGEKTSRKTIERDIKLWPTVRTSREGFFKRKDANHLMWGVWAG